jgi:hypothetical protein
MYHFMIPNIIFRVVFMLILVVGYAFGQSTETAPAHIANIWDGKAHEPDPSLVESGERARGLILDPQRDRAVTDEVEDQYQRLMPDEGMHDRDAAAGGPRNDVVTTPHSDRSVR